ncbi:adenosylmethionine decarboxylase [Ornatilinea apprima]|nr:adenosylmethionine decarboxylase [Ornatilinea apprima]
MNGQLKLGEHYICDLSNCDQERLMDARRSRDLFYQAVFESGLTIVSEGYYEFSPHGFTCFLLLAESHASLHAWPEHGYCAIDLFTCNLDLDIQPLINRLQVMFGAADISVRKIEREAEVREPCLI